MRLQPEGATFWRLGGLSGWQERTASGDLAVSDRMGLRLAAAPSGPLSLQSADGSVGGLVLPRGMAIDRELTVYLLVNDRVRRYDAETRAFVDYARFESATSIAIAGNWLYVTRPAVRRVDVLDLTKSTLVDVLERPGWEPVDVAAHNGAAYILDAARGRVYKHAPYERLELVVKKTGPWSRIVVDRDGGLYLFNGVALEPDAAPVGDAGAVRDLFDPPIIRLDEQGRFCLPASMAGV